MPNPKTGTVTPDVAKAVSDAKGGKIEYRTERTGIVHAPIGKSSFTPEDLQKNLTTVLEALQRQKPATAKGIYMQSVTLSTTMGPGIRVDASSVVK